MVSIRLLSEVLEWLSVSALSVTVAFVMFMIYRRVMRNRYYAAKDAARARFQSIVDDGLRDNTHIANLVRRLGPLVAPAQRDALEQLLFSRLTSDYVNKISELLMLQGYVQRWSQQVFGSRLGHKLTLASFTGGTIPRGIQKTPGAYNVMDWLRRRHIFAVHRAVALNKLGKLSPNHASIFLASALNDPSEIVRRVAIERMGENTFAAAIPLLMEELRRSVEKGNDVSLRTIQSALIRYRVEDMDAFLPFFRHPTRRMRFFVVETLREICHRQSQAGLLGEAVFSSALRAELLHHGCQDEFADVRASSAGVVRHFKNSAAVAALRELLTDKNEYVRLHAVHACAHPWFAEQGFAEQGFAEQSFADSGPKENGMAGQGFSPLIAELLKRVTDVNWRVREAAVTALTALEPEGFSELCHFFASSSDRYACEQIAEEFQRRGLVERIVVGLPLAGEAATLHLAVCRKLLCMGQTAMLIAAVGSVTSPKFRVSFTESLAIAPEEEFMKVLQEIADPQPGSEKGGVLQLLYRFGSQPISAVRMA